MKTTSKKASAQDCAQFTITGTVEKVYRGRDNDYASIKVQPNPDDYYDLIRVACPKDAEIEEGDSVTASGTISTFFDRNKKVQNINFNASEVKPR